MFGTVHPQSVDALFEAASHINMRMIAGKVMMDRNAPDYLLDTAESSYHQSKELIERWHKNGRLLYAITPRFAPTSSPEQMAMAQRLKEEYPDTWVHTHLCENKDEIAWVKSLYPDHDGYLDVYHQYGLTGKNCVFAHCVHLEEKEWDRLSGKPNPALLSSDSNSLPRQRLSNLKKAWQKKVKVAGNRYLTEQFLTCCNAKSGLAYCNLLRSPSRHMKRFTWPRSAERNLWALTTLIGNLYP